jgi:hypothetical protein
VGGAGGAARRRCYISAAAVTNRGPLSACLASRLPQVAAPALPSRLVGRLRWPRVWYSSCVRRRLSVFGLHCSIATSTIVLFAMSHGQPAPLTVLSERR